MSGKFENIQVGDVVYIKTSLRQGFSVEKSFFLPYTVTRLTPTMFEVRDNKYRKSNGKQVTSDYGKPHAYSLGELSGFDQTPVTDQTDEYRLYKIHIIRHRNVIDLCNSIIKRIKYDTILVEIESKLREIDKLLNEQLL